MNIACLIAGFIFLSNPNVGIIDFLPDFIGCCLIIHGIGLAKLYSPDWKDASRIAVILGVVNGIKTACIPLLYRDIRALPILLSFSFALVEGFLLVSLTNKFFEGLFYVGMRYDISAVFAVKGSSDIRNNKTEVGVKIKHFAVGFFIFRSLLSILPDISDLQIASEKQTVFTYSDLHKLFNATVLIIGSVAAIVFLFKFIPALIGIKNDPNKKSFDELCNNLIQNPVIRDKLNLRRLIVLASIAVVTSLFLSVDGMIIPALVSAIFIVLFSVCSGRYDNRVYIVIPFSLLGAGVSVFDLIYRFKYFIDMDHVPEDSVWIHAATETYNMVTLFTLIERLLLWVSLVIILYFLYKKIKSDADSITNAGNDDMFEKEKFGSYFRKFRISIFTGIPLFVLSALEPKLLLVIDFLSVVLSVMYLIWIVSVMYVFSDIFRSMYSDLPNEN